MLELLLAIELKLATAILLDAAEVDAISESDCADAAPRLLLVLLLPLLLLLVLLLELLEAVVVTVRREEEELAIAKLSLLLSPFIDRTGVRRKWEVK